MFDWMKGLLVTPEIKPHKAIALVGPPGCGKHAVAELLRRMLGGGAVLMGDASKETRSASLYPSARSASSAVKVRADSQRGVVRSPMGGVPTRRRPVFRYE